MKPVPFEYDRPDNVEAVCEILANDEDAQIIAGGQSLIPMLAMRLARPSRLVDIGRIEALAGINANDQQLVIGAVARHGEALGSKVVRSTCPLLAAALPWVGHGPIRARGTLGGSVAHADPAAEVPLVLATLGGTVTLVSNTDTRILAASEFFAGPLMTATRSDECLTQIRFPVWQDPRLGVGFREIANRRSDFAIVAAAAQIALDEDDKCVACTAGLGGIVDTPIQLPVVAEALFGIHPDTDAIRDVSNTATAHLPAMDDPYASAAYRRRAAARLLEQALTEAVSDARSQGEEREA